jgi:polar amino acid transport system permease protein
VEAVRVKVSGRRLGSGIGRRPVVVSRPARACVDGPVEAYELRVRPGERRCGERSLNAAFFFAAIGLGLNEAAYMAEIVRAGITLVPEGQTEAASWSLTMRRIVLPQAMRVIIPLTGNEVISMLKTTSLLVAVPYTLDLYMTQRGIAGVLYRPVPLLLVASTWYLAITSVLMIGQHYLERYFARGSSRHLTARPLRELAKAQAQDGAGAR